MDINTTAQRDRATREMDDDAKLIEDLRRQISLAEERISANKVFLEALHTVESRLALDDFDDLTKQLPGIETGAPAKQIPFAESVRNAVSTFLDEQFTVEDIERVLRKMKVPLPERNLRTRITVEVIPMHKKGILEIVHRGTGKVPNRYRFIGFAEKGEGASRAPSISNQQH